MSKTFLWFQIVMAIIFLIYGRFTIITRFARIGRGSKPIYIRGVAAISLGIGYITTGLIWIIGAIMQLGDINTITLFYRNISTVDFYLFGLINIGLCFFISIFLELLLKNKKSGSG